MSTTANNQQTYCRVAQFYRGLCIFPRHETAHKRILSQIDDVNLKVMSDTLWKESNLYDSRMRCSTLLHIACFRKNVGAVDILIKRGADFTAKNDEGCTALYYAFVDIFSGSNENLKTTIGILRNKPVNSVLMAHVESGNCENSVSTGGLSHFHIACAANHLQAVELVLNTGVSVDESVNVDSSIFPGYTPLHFAAKFCSYATAKLLLERGANLGVKDVKGLSPLHIVVETYLKLVQLKKEKYREDLTKLDNDMKECENIVRLFLESNAAVDVDSMNFRKIHAACVLSDSSFAERFFQDININRAVSMDSPMWPGYTPLHLASLCNMNTVKLLLKNGANIEAKNTSGVTPFDICMKNYVIEDLHDILSEVSILKDILFSDNQTKLSDFISAMRSLSTVNDFYQTTPKNICLPENCSLWPGYYLSHLAVFFSESYADDFFNIKECLSLHGYAKSQDTCGRTPIHLAFYERKNDIVDLFFENQSAISDIVDNNGLSHLHIACKRANEDVVQTLLFQGANINATYKGETIMSSGSTPLHIAVARGNVEVVKILLRHKANPNATDDNGMTSIHYTLTMCPPESQKTIGDLLFSSCNLTNAVCSKNRLNHLHVASFIGNEDAVEGLLKLGADPNSIFSSQSLGRTPLHFAIMKNHTVVTEILLEDGADILHKRFNGMTLLYEILNESGDELPSEFDDTSTKAYFASMLVNNVTLQKRVEDDTGITLLHIACAMYDTDQIQSLLPHSGANAQVHLNSPIWPGATPLHLLVKFGNDVKDLEDAIKPLLECGSNVSLMDGDGNTPIHSFLRHEEQYSQNSATFSDCNLLQSLIRCHKDFSSNPTNKRGISHFHVACMVSEYTIVEKFLENGADVNLPINFRDDSMTFQTPLHLVLNPRLNGRPDTESQFRTIDLLLKYGADVNGQDEYCSTPLVEAAARGPLRELFFKKLVKVGADLNYINPYGQTVLETVFTSADPITMNELKFLVNNHVNFNIFSPYSGKGIISYVYQANFQRFLKAIMEKPSLFVIDEMGRTPIHNIIADEKKGITTKEYSSYIERFVKLGFDIDAQDSAGNTALHLAALRHKDSALSALLSAGADVNVTDKKNEPSITQNFRVRYRYRCRNRRVERVPRPMKRNFALHTVALQLCGLEVHSENLKLANSIPRKESFRSYCEEVLREIEMTKFVTIGTGSVKLKDFLSETGVVASRPSMASEVDRQAVDKLLESIDFKNFPKISGLIKMQHRKMLTRLRLLDKAKDSMKKLLGSVNGFSMPENCCCMIIRFLTNTEVKNLIASMTSE